MKWIPRVFNLKADFLSRHVDFDDWETSFDLFKYLDELWGPHSIDRFADENNHKVSRFNSLFYSPNSEAIDAFSQNCGNENNVLVPLFRKYLKLLFALGKAKLGELLCSHIGNHLRFGLC